MGRTLITGDAGFIGFHLSRRLLERGDQVLGYDGMTEYYDLRLKRDRLARLGTYPAFTHVTGMLEDRELIAATVESFTPDVVVHLAAQAGVRYSIEHPETYISSNVVGTFNLLEAMRGSMPKHFMFASTSSVYGGNVKIPFSELDRADAPVSLYAATKKANESMVHSYSHLWKLPATGFRFFTVYGPWGRPDMALFKFVSAIERDEPIDVYGHGKMRRDFTYVDDLVNAIAQLADRVPAQGEKVSVADTLSPVAPYRVVNIAGGAPVGLLEFIEAIETALGKTVERNLLPMQAGDIVETFADPTLLRDLIGEVPETTIAEGVRLFVDWYRSYYATGLI